MLEGIEINSDAWVATGRLLFTTHTLDLQEWLDGNGPLPESKPFEFRCPVCRTTFASVVTPRQCPDGHLADDIGDDAVTVEHKGYSAKTFPFRSF